MIINIYENKPNTNYPRAHRLRIKDNISSDIIIPPRLKFQNVDPKELVKHVFEDLDPEFHKRIKQGDYLIAGENFGCGSTSEQVPLALKSLGIKAVIAKNFARIFYRNSFNVGLLLLECNTNYIDDQDMIDFNSEKHTLTNASKGIKIDIAPLPMLIRKIIEDGGVIEYYKKYGRFLGEA